MNNFKFEVGDHIRTIKTKTPGVILKRYEDTVGSSTYHHYIVHCTDESNIMVIDENNIELDNEYMPISNVVKRRAV